MQDVFDTEDEFAIPDPGYEVPRRRVPNSNRRLALIATAIGVSLVGIGGGLELASRRNATVPVITADSRPIRVRPENPGGMQVIGANESLLSDSGTEALAPPPEAPDTRALHAQLQAEAARAEPLPPSPAVLAQTGSAAPDVPLPPGSSEGTPARTAQVAPRVAPPAAQAKPVPAPARVAAATPAQPVAPPQSATHAVAMAQPMVATHAAMTAVAPPPATVTPTPAAMTALAPPAAAGRKIAQLASVDSEAAATAEWDRLAKRMPDLLGKRHPEIVKFEHDGHVFYRLRTAGFTDSNDAAAFCTRVKSKGANCAVF